ncbi:MAG: thioredoxin domain-containing protein [Actinomycetaceae bacterium]|nr:thioredoxin domain-containing protein [Actinomycetaceae bacterium]
MPSTNSSQKDKLNRNQRRSLNREQAREQAHALKAKENAKKKRTRILAIVAATALIAAVIGIAVVLVKNANNTAVMTNNDGLPHVAKTITMEAPKNVTEYGGIPLGKDLKAGTVNEGVPQIDIYFDYSCHHCNDLSNEYGAALTEAAQKGEITLVYHPVASMQGLFSFTGAVAEFYVASNEPEKYLKFHDLLHEKLMTPYMAKTIETPQAKDIGTIARQAGLSDSTYQGLMEELTATENALLKDQSKASSIPLLIWVSEVTNQFIKDSEALDNKGTPTVYFDGKKLDNWKEDLPNLLNK